MKSTEAHDYKYPTAIFEDYYQVHPSWRPHMLAASCYYLQSSKRPDSPLMLRARESVRSI